MDCVNTWQRANKKPIWTQSPTHEVAERVEKHMRRVAVELSHDWQEMFAKRSLRVEAEVPQTSVLGRMRADLTDLNNDEDPDVRPTTYASIRAWFALSQVGFQLKERLPYGYIMDDGANGVRIEWDNGPKQVRVVIPSTSGSYHYIYHEAGEYHGAEDFSISALVGWLNWLIEA